MKNTIYIQSAKNGKDIFSYTCENNTMRKTIEEAVKQGISLKNAYLSHCDLSNLVLNNVNLSHADLSFCNLQNIKLTNVDLQRSTLLYSDLSNGILDNVNLSYAVLANTICSMATFERVNFYYSNCHYASMADSKFIDVKGVNDQCPKEGSFIGWKKCFDRNNKTFCVVKLEIPADAKRCSGTTNKCRCSKAKVLEIQNLDGTIADTTVVCSSFYNSNIVHYKINEIIYPNWFDDYFWNECSNGIHFFMNRDEAINYL